jgi:hypothetical protein
LLACSYPSIPSPVSDVYTRYLNSFRRFEYCRIMDQKLISLDSLLILLFPEKPIPEPLWIINFIICDSNLICCQVLW